MGLLCALTSRLIAICAEVCALLEQWWAVVLKWKPGSQFKAVFTDTHNTEFHIKCSKKHGYVTSGDGWSGKYRSCIIKTMQDVVTPRGSGELVRTKEASKLVPVPWLLVVPKIPWWLVANYLQARHQQSLPTFLSFKGLRAWVFDSAPLGWAWVNIYLPDMNFSLLKLNQPELQTILQETKPEIWKLAFIKF